MPDTPAPPIRRHRHTWVIDVCATCHRLAVWPFCGHRPTGFTPDDQGWTTPVQVTGTVRLR